MTITPDEVRVRLGVIYGSRHDDEVAHSEEDKLHLEVLTAIADGAENARELARLAIATKGFLFKRWCA